MPMKCCIPGCNSNYNGTDGYVKIFSIPNNPVRRQQWLERIPREDWTPSRSSFVCIKHFKVEDVVIGKQRWKLTPTAVPSIFPDATLSPAKRNRYVRKQFRVPSATDEYLKPEVVGNFGGVSDVIYCEIEDDVQIKVALIKMYCCIPGCISNRRCSNEGFIKIFRIPSDPVVRQMWVDLIPRKNWTPGKYSVVCIKHFKKEDFYIGSKRWKLKPNAVPRITGHNHLSGNDTGQRTFAQRNGYGDGGPLQNAQEYRSPELIECIADIGNYTNENEQFDLEENEVHIKEEPTSIDDSGMDDLHYQNSEEPTSCGESAYDDKKHAVEYTSATEIDTYRFEVLSKYWTEKMKMLKNEQRIYAEKLINDVLFEAELGRLSHDCYVTNQ